jgi:hypothetical protein
MFRISGEGFGYTAKALGAPYPEYWKILAAEDKCDARLTLTQESAQTLQKFLDGNKEETSARLTVFPDRIVLLETDDKTRRQRTGVFEARCHGAGVPGTVHLDTRYLRQFLKMGFLSMSMSSKAPVPLASSSGIGKYLFMPMRIDAQSPVPESNPATAIPSHSDTTPKPQPEEKKTMTQTVNTTTAATSPASFAKTQPNVQSNPLDETLSSLVSMRETLSGLEARLLEAGRRIKAALVEQRLKERQYADATRKLERIRLAV